LISRIVQGLRQQAGDSNRASRSEAQATPRRAGVEAAGCAVRIYALGGFSLALRGIPFLGGTKPSRRPMDLLKALIANGGGLIAASTLADMLWPDADGDDARNSLQVAVYRLRRLLRCDSAVVVQDGRISLDRERAWVDAWAFEREAARVLQAEEDPRLVLAGAAGALELYRGHLFAHEPDQPWMLSYRERLRMTWGRVVRQTGAMQESSGRWERAAELYQKALELDPLLEDLYRRLMLCQQRAGERSAALHTYECCRQQLVRVLGVSPSLETERLYRALRSAA
jgi:two-component SAPR family response regulator